MKFFGAFRPLVDHDIDHLRNHVAGALDHHRIADPDIAALAQLLALVADPLDVILIVQRDVLHDDAADTDRLELADRRERAGAPDLNLDIAQHRHGALGRKLVRDGPARGARDKAETFLPIEPIDLVDDAVDIVVEPGALLFDLAVKRDQLLDRMADLGERIGLEAAMLEPGDHAGLRVLRHVSHFAPGIGEEAERARGGDRRVFLAQRTGGRIARIGKDGAAFRLLPLVEREKRLLGHVDLAAHLANLRHLAAFQLLRHVFQRADVGGDVLAFRAVAARRRRDEFAVLVTQRHREPVDLGLGGKVDRLVLGQFQEAADAADEIDDVFFRKGIVERKHRYGMADFFESGRKARRRPSATASAASTNSGKRFSMALKRWRSASYSASVTLGASS